MRAIRERLRRAKYRLMNYLQFQLSIGTPIDKKVKLVFARFGRTYIPDFGCPLRNSWQTFNQFFNVQKPKRKNSI